MHVRQYVYYAAVMNVYAKDMNTFWIPYMRYYRCMVKKIKRRFLQEGDCLPLTASFVCSTADNEVAATYLRRSPTDGVPNGAAS